MTLELEKSDSSKIKYNYVYMLRCVDGSFYTGWTNNLENRVEKHNSGKGAKYTRGRLPVTLIYFEKFIDRVEAMRREYEIKQLTRAQKEVLIERSK